MATLLTEVKELRAEVKREADPTRPLTAADLCERWHIEGETPQLKLKTLARKCGRYGLKQLKGGQGWNALYLRSHVLRAEELAAGKIRSRKTKPKTRTRRSASLPTEAAAA